MRIWRVQEGALQCRALQDNAYRTGENFVGQWVLKIANQSQTNHRDIILRVRQVGNPSPPPLHRSPMNNSFFMPLSNVSTDQPDSKFLDDSFPGCKVSPASLKNKAKSVPSTKLTYSYYFNIPDRWRGRRRGRTWSPAVWTLSPCPPPARGAIRIRPQLSSSSRLGKSLS